jgi:4-hydroxy-tetrahydrodipicolinate reductase
MIKVAVIGATGRMGQALIRAARETNGVRIAAAVASERSAHLGRDAGQLADQTTLGACVTSDLRAALSGCDVAIDFSRPSVTSTHLAICREVNKPLLIGTTGFPSELTTEFIKAARDIPLLIAPNTSISVTLLLELVRACARALPTEFDINITEMHHRDKKDAPSGTALVLGRAAAKARGHDLDEVAVTNRSNRSHATLRREGEIGFASLRGGDIVGEHTVSFTAPGEQLLLTHRALDRAIFARGALKAASWLAVQPVGLYSMQDVVGYKSGT